MLKEFETSIRFLIACVGIALVFSPLAYCSSEVAKAKHLSEQVQIEINE